jgi:hypothetical protein
MNAPDLINGALELLGGIFVLNHCLTLYQSKQSRGVSKVSAAYFSIWGLWNLFYYPHLEQWWSFSGGVLIVAANTLWVALMIRYRKN